MNWWSREQLEELKGRPAYGRGAFLVGMITEVLLDPDDARGWITVDTGRSAIVIPLDDATVTNSAVYLPLDAERLQALSGRGEAGRAQVERFYDREE